MEVFQLPYSAIYTLRIYKLKSTTPKRKEWTRERVESQQVTARSLTNCTVQKKRLMPQVKRKTRVSEVPGMTTSESAG